MMNNLRKALLASGFFLFVASRAQASLFFPDNAFNDPVNGSGGLVVSGSETPSGSIGTQVSSFSTQLISDAFGGAMGTSPEDVPGTYGDFLFNDGPDLDTLTFSTSSPVTLSGIYLATSSDEYTPTSNRGASEATFAYYNGTSYQIVADTNAQSIVVLNDALPQLIPFPGGPITASSFEISFTPNTIYGNSGVRLVDLAAVPEPTSIVVLVAIGVPCLLRRVRKPIESSLLS